MNTTIKAALIGAAGLMGAAVVDLFSGCLTPLASAAVRAESSAFHSHIAVYWYLTHITFAALLFWGVVLAVFGPLAVIWCFRCRLAGRAEGHPNNTPKPARGSRAARGHGVRVEVPDGKPSACSGSTSKLYYRAVGNNGIICGMKLSVSVPDDLWEQARGVQPELNPSRVVQRALEQWCGDRPPAFPHDPPSDVTDAFALARDRLAAHARAEFERGYRQAVKVARTMKWWALEALADQHFNVRSWAQNLTLAAQEEQDGAVSKGAGPDKETLMSLREALGPAMPWGDHDDLVAVPTAPYLKGFSVAMRDLWEAAFEGPVGRSVSGSRSGAHSGSSTGTLRRREAWQMESGAQASRAPQGQ